MPSAQTILFALLGGVLPALLWLWFWLKEDRLHPEPRKLILLSFMLGMVAVFIVLPIERYVEKYIASAALVMILWAVGEELIKLAAAWGAALRKKDCDEPIDLVIYLISAALGFASLENTMFLASAITNESLVSGVVTGNLRFVGASLLHVLASGVIGLFLGISFYRGAKAKVFFLILGFALATTLHVLFNFFIIESKGSNTLIVFSFVWLSIILFLAALEKVKRIRKNSQNLKF